MIQAYNTTDVISVGLSQESLRMLEDLAARGIYGRTSAEVAARFIDAALQQFADVPRLEAQQTKGRRR